MEFRVPPSLLAWGVVLFCLFVLSGGIYNILENPPSFLPYGNKILTLDPRSSEQTIYESLFIFLSNAAAFMGLVISYRSTQVAYDRSKANRYLVLGIALTLAGIIGNYIILELKRTILG